MLDRSRPFVQHFNEETGQTLEQDGVFYRTNGDLLTAVVQDKPVKAEVVIPEGFKKGPFGRIVPV